jgi:DNA replication protein DnaC
VLNLKTYQLRSNSAQAWSRRSHYCNFEQFVTFLGIQNPNRPIASFLFCGPGVGKTEVTKALAVSMFGAESDMIRFDMSEFMEKFTVSRLMVHHQVMLDMMMVDN